MKKCLKCGEVYADATLNFCLNDGEYLVFARDDEPPPTRFADDSPPTVLMNQPRVTNPIDWAPGSPPARWESPQQPAQMFAASYPTGRNQTLATVSLILGIISVFMVCCAGGIWLGLPAAVVGFFALRNADSNPERYGGRGLAMAGMVLGVITFFASVFFLIFGQLS